MSDNYIKTKKIFVNTIVLYMRMLITMIITLYSSRIVLQALGVEDYGIFSVVGGVVALLTFLKSSFASSSQRFISYELGIGKKGRLSQVFGACVTAHILISIVILFLAETIGLWFLNTQMNIPDGRIEAANWVYQLSLASLVLSMISAPFNADIISHEKMTFYAVVGILESFLKLGFALLLLVFDVDQLILYAILTFVLNLLVFLSYVVYCLTRFEESKTLFYFEKTLFKRVFSFSGWTVLGQSSVVAANYGTSILVNIFYSVAANAAMGIGQQVNGAITGLTSNFQMAFQPQITKSYAAGDFSYLNMLISYTSKISFFLLFIVTYPILLNIDFVLSTWLTVVPEYANIFCVLYIIASLFNALGTSLWTSIFASGSINTYQITSSFIFFSDILVVYFLFKIGFPPPACMMVKAAVNLVVLFVRILFAKHKVQGFSAAIYMKETMGPCLFASLLTIICSLPIYFYSDTPFLKGLATILAIGISLLSMLFVGLKKSERNSLINIINKKIKKHYEDN
ncbi:lipopolysaccharide biosynthesis protein [Bacteroides graminisolvens]